MMCGVARVVRLLRLLEHDIKVRCRVSIAKVVSVAGVTGKD